MLMAWHPSTTSTGSTTTPFDSLALASLTQFLAEARNCRNLPWTIGDVLAHLAFGLGVGYPMAMRAAPDATAAEAFAELSIPSPPPRGRAARVAFLEHLDACAAAFRATDPGRPCFTYAGPGVAGFWFRRAAIEMSLHRIDVAEALDGTHRLAADRLADAIAESAEFALPFAAALLGETPPAARVADSAVSPRRWHPLGLGDAEVSFSADGHELLAALWGRPAEVTCSGDPDVADQWLSLVRRAFG